MSVSKPSDRKGLGACPADAGHRATEASLGAADASPPSGSVSTGAGDFAIPSRSREDYITAGKPYRLLQDFPEAGVFEISDDDGDRIICLWSDCAHLRGGSWKRVTAAAAQAIEARRAATGTGAVEDESAVGNADAPKDSGQ